MASQNRRGQNRLVAVLMAVGCYSGQTSNKKPTKIGTTSNFAQCIGLLSPTNNGDLGVAVGSSRRSTLRARPTGAHVLVNVLTELSVFALDRGNDRARDLLP